MLTEELKTLMENAGGKYIIIEDGKPRYVFMSWNEYKTFARGQRAVQTLTEEELLDRINADIALWRESQKREGEEEEILQDEVEELEDIEYIS